MKHRVKKTDVLLYEFIEGNYEKSLEYYMELLEREPENSQGFC